MKEVKVVNVDLSLPQTMTGRAHRQSQLVVNIQPHEKRLEGLFLVHNAIFARVRTHTYTHTHTCLLYTSPSPRDISLSRMPSSA